MIELEQEKEKNLRRATEKIRELTELREQYNFDEISETTFAEMATGKAKKLAAILDYYNRGKGVYWD